MLTLKLKLVPLLIITVIIINHSFADNLNSNLKKLSIDKQIIDQRISLNLTKTEKKAFLTEMRQMLFSIQGIMVGIGENNPDKIIKSARYSGNRMARQTPQSIKLKTPQSFKEIGGPTHMMFEELVIRAETDDMEDLILFTAEIMQQCLSCHELFKVD